MFNFYLKWFLCYYLSSYYRTDGRIPEYSVCDGSPPSTHDAHTGHGWLSHFQPNSPSRFRQQSAHSVNHMYSANLHGECTPQASQHSHSNYGLADSHSPHTSLLGNGNAWGMLSSSCANLSWYGYVFYNWLLILVLQT